MRGHLTDCVKLCFAVRHKTQGETFEFEHVEKSSVGLQASIVSHQSQTSTKGWEQANTACVLRLHMMRSNQPESSAWTSNHGVGSVWCGKVLSFAAIKATMRITNST